MTCISPDLLVDIKGMVWKFPKIRKVKNTVNTKKFFVTKKIK
jgi:hypothetical protein